MTQQHLPPGFLMIVGAKLGTSEAILGDVGCIFALSLEELCVISKLIAHNHYWNTRIALAPASLNEHEQTLNPKPRHANQGQPRLKVNSQSNHQIRKTLGVA